METNNSTAYISTAYLGPIQLYTKLYSYPEIMLEVHENYLKQTYRNRCIIAAANGAQTLTIPIEKPQTLKCLTKDIRISDHGNWRHLHWNALVSAYNMSPFFEYYEDDFAPFYEKKYEFLLDFNEALREVVCALIDLQPNITETTEYRHTAGHDFRNAISPKGTQTDNDFVPAEYYQVFKNKYGFLSNLSIADLLFNMGPESSLVLKNSIRHRQ